jgi:serine/threonine protein kinase
MEGAVCASARISLILEVMDEDATIADADSSEPTRSTEDAAPGEDPRFGFAKGDRIGRYRLIEVLGEGGFGVVWKAEQTEPVRRVVAIKLIKPGMDSKSVVARFEAERQALAVMDHPNIARVLDGGATDAGYPYFVMELVKGVPITDFCDTQRMSINKRLELFAEVCHAVQHAHMKGVVHRDLKPSNVLIEYDAGTGDPHPKVIDFGVAKALNQRLTEATLFTERGQIIGTPEYMSPEQAEMSGVDIDTRSDVYSLGVMLYELLTGMRPFDLKRAALLEIQRVIREVEPSKPSTRLSALSSEAHGGRMPDELPKGGRLPAALDTDITAITHARREDPRHLRSLLKRDLDWVVMKALEKDRTRRYDTATDLADELQRFLNHEPVQAGPPSASYRLSKFVRRNKGAVLSGGLAIVSLLVALGGMGWGLSRANQATEQEKAYADSLATVNEQLRETIVNLNRAEEAVETEQAATVAAQSENAAKYSARLKMISDAIDSEEFSNAAQALGVLARQDRGWEWWYLWGRVHAVDAWIPLGNSPGWGNLRSVTPVSDDSLLIVTGDDYTEQAEKTLRLLDVSSGSERIIDSMMPMPRSQSSRERLETRVVRSLATIPTSSGHFLVKEQRMEPKYNVGSGLWRLSLASTRLVLGHYDLEPGEWTELAIEPGDPWLRGQVGESGRSRTIDMMAIADEGRLCVGLREFKNNPTALVLDIWRPGHEKAHRTVTIPVAFGDRKVKDWMREMSYSSGPRMNMAVDPSGSFMCIADGSNLLVVIDLKQETAQAFKTTGGSLGMGRSSLMIEPIRFNDEVCFLLANPESSSSASSILINASQQTRHVLEVSKSRAHPVKVMPRPGEHELVFMWDFPEYATRERLDDLDHIERIETLPIRGNDTNIGSLCSSFDGQSLLRRNSRMWFQSPPANPDSSQFKQVPWHRYPNQYPQSLLLTWLGPLRTPWGGRYSEESEDSMEWRGDHTLSGSSVEIDLHRKLVSRADRRSARTSLGAVVFETKVIATPEGVNAPIRTAKVIDGSVQIVDENGGLLFTLPNDGEQITGVAVSPTGDHLVGRTVDGDLLWWSAEPVLMPDAGSLAHYALTNLAEQDQARQTLSEITGIGDRVRTEAGRIIATEALAATKVRNHVKFIWSDDPKKIEDIDRVIRWYDKWIRPDGPVPGIDLDRARLLFKAGRIEEAKAAFENWVSDYRSDSVRSLAARIYIEQRKPREAAQELAGGIFGTQVDKYIRAWRSSIVKGESKPLLEFKANPILDDLWEESTGTKAQAIFELLGGPMSWSSFTQSDQESTGTTIRTSEDDKWPLQMAQEAVVVAINTPRASIFASVDIDPKLMVEYADWVVALPLHDSVSLRASAWRARCLNWADKPKEALTLYQAVLSECPPGTMTEVLQVIDLLIELQDVQAARVWADSITPDLVAHIDGVDQRELLQQWSEILARRGMLLICQDDEDADAIIDIGLLLCGQAAQFDSSTPTVKLANAVVDARRGDFDALNLNLEACQEVENWAWNDKQLLSALSIFASSATDLDEAVTTAVIRLAEINRDQFASYRYDPRARYWLEKTVKLKD